MLLYLLIIVLSPSLLIIYREKKEKGRRQNNTTVLVLIIKEKKILTTTSSSQQGGVGSYVLCGPCTCAACFSLGCSWYWRTVTNTPGCNASREVSAYQIAMMAMEAKDMIPGLIESLQQVQEKYKQREQELIQKHEEERILWEDEKAYLETEISTIEDQYKKIAIEKGKYHKLYVSLRSEKGRLNDQGGKETPDRSGSIIAPRVATPNTATAEPLSKSSTTPDTADYGVKNLDGNIQKKNKLAPTALIIPSMEDGMDRAGNDEIIQTSKQEAPSPQPHDRACDNNKAASPGQATFSSVTSAQMDESFVGLNGWLSVVTEDYSYAVRRWVSLRDNGMLLLYVDSFATTPVQGFKLRNYTVRLLTGDENTIANSNTTGTLSFIIENESRTVKYTFQCKDLEERKKWFSTLSAACTTFHSKTEMLHLRDNLIKHCQSDEKAKENLARMFKLMDERQEIIAADAMLTAKRMEKQKVKVEEESKRKPLQAIECKLKLRNIAKNVQRLKKMKQEVLRMKAAMM